ncbi:hypothetical protein ACH4OQ_12535 [Streptomyces luteogriseus]|uniref:hypothetical protein n=1 Tax=Streptomyces luteogriseus TaxID=68233 RepID=UPI00379BC0B0
MSIADAYWHECRGRFGRLPVWLPGTPMELGDVGVLGPTGWLKKTTLQGLGLPMAEDPPGSATDYEYASQGGVTVTAGTAINAALPVADAYAGVTYRFTRAGAFVLKAYGATVRRLANVGDVETGMLRLHETDKWQAGWTVVTEVTTAQSVLTLISESEDTEVSVGLRAAVQLPTAEVSATPRFVLGNWRGSAVKLLTDSPTALLWRGLYVDDPILRRARGAVRGTSEDEGRAARAHGPGRARAAEVEFPDDILVTDVETGG